MRTLLLVMCILVVIGATRGPHAVVATQNSEVVGGPLLLVLVGMLIWHVCSKGKG